MKSLCLISSLLACGMASAQAPAVRAIRGAAQQHPHARALSTKLYATATIAGTTCSTAGIIFTVAGNDTADYTGDGGAASAATVNTPNGVAIDGAGNLYIADTGNNLVRRLRHNIFLGQ